MHPFFFLSLPLFFQVVSALLNVTIDDTDPSITYQGVWEPSSEHLSSLDYGGGHAVSADTSASATFTFTGVAVYYVVPRWPYAVNTQLALDGGQGVIVNLTDPAASTTDAGGSESAQASVAWSATSLSNMTHKLVLSMASTGYFIVSDAFIFTVDNGTSAPSSTASKAASQTGGGSAADSASPSSIPARSDTLVIALGSGLGLAALLAAGILAFFILRRRKRPRPVSNVLDEWGTDAYPPPPVPFIAAPERPTHGPSMSDASTGPLLAMSWDRSQYRDEPRRGTMSPRESVSEYSSTAFLPPGARAAEPLLNAEEDPSELASGSSSIARRTSTSASRLLAATSARREKAQPFRKEVHTPAPPAYSES